MDSEKLGDKIEQAKQGKDASLRLYEMERSHERCIEEEVKSAQKLVDVKMPITSLINDYSPDNSPQYFKKAQLLAERYKHIRKVRGDGNCFYRALLFSILEQLLEGGKDQREKFVQKCKSWKDELISQGFDSLTTSDFFDTFIDFLESEESRTEEGIYEAVNEEMNSNYYVVFARLSTSSYLRKNAAFYEGFLDQGHTVDTYCKAQIEVVNSEADHLAIEAAVNAFGFSLCIEYLDQAEGDVQKHLISPTGEGLDGKPICLLYRLNHYDILY